MTTSRPSTPVPDDYQVYSVSDPDYGLKRSWASVLARCTVCNTPQWRQRTVFVKSEIRWLHEFECADCKATYYADDKGDVVDAPVEAPDFEIWID